jgi:UDP-N-acetylglucosamine 2-epimerase (non-hydrolysing)
MTVVGTRPEIIRLSLVIRKLDASPAIENTLVHTGQNYDYELNEIFFEDMEVRKPDAFLEAAGKNASETIGQVIIKIDDVLEQVRPDAFLVLGDTNSAFCAVPAKKRHIPIFHMEAGNRCFDQRVPEEINRKIIDHISDINMPYSDIGREALLREGIPADRIVKTGSPMFEVLHHSMPKVRQSTVLLRLGLSPQNYFVVSAHREENIASKRQFDDLCATLNQAAEQYRLPLVVTTHPRTRKMIEARNITFHEQVRLEKPFAFSDYLALQFHAKATLSDSGTISEESSILGFPALNIREAHERPEAMEETSVMMTGLNPERVMRGLAQLESERRLETQFRTVADYTMPNVSDKVVRIILSHTDFIKRVVWGELP